MIGRRAGVLALAVAGATASLWLVPDAGERLLPAARISSRPHALAAPLLPAAKISSRPHALAAPLLPAAPAAAFSVPRPRPLDGSTLAVLWAPVRTGTIARTEPDAAAAPVVPLTARTPEGTTNLVLVLGRKRDGGGRLWVHVRLPVLPNGSTGWVPRDVLGGYGVAREHLVVDLERLTATLFDGARPVFQAPVGVGKPASPTPRGEFYIRDELSSYASPFYGPVAFGTSARSAALTDWPAGGFIGIHGTDQPGLLPGRVSHGCIRMSNTDILHLARLMSVGTPLTIR